MTESSHPWIITPDQLTAIQDSGVAMASPVIVISCQSCGAEFSASTSWSYCPACVLRLAEMPQAALQPPSSRDELRAYLAALGEKVHGSLMAPKIDKFVLGRFIPLLLRDTPAMNELMDEGVAELNRG